MRVYLSFDVEVWCNDWSQLDERFPSAFQRYVFGRSSHGDYALPKTLEILNRFGLIGVFFVEPLFAARFGIEHLATITSLIHSAGQDVQLHLHTEWVDELPAPPIADHSRKRQHLHFHTAEEQRTLVGFALGLMDQAGVSRPQAFRAGSFACNRDTFRALRDNGIQIDSSLNACTDISGADLRPLGLHEKPGWIEDVYSVPVAVYDDGFGKPRSAQVNGSSFGELRQALESASACGCTDFVIVSHNFEMLKPGLSVPDPLVVKRFESLCRYLDDNRQRYEVGVYQAPDVRAAVAPSAARPHVRPLATLGRYAEQLRRRF
jgi:hypothetical protein